MDKFLFHIHRGMLEFVGYDVISPFITHEPVRLDDEARKSALADAKAYVTNKVVG
jgi:NAD(P)H dehydrogenase (quinone)